MTTIYLVRHATHSLLNTVLCGRSDDIGLAAEGLDQARKLAPQFAGASIDLVQCSPRRRTQETAAPIARQLGLAVQRAERMDELDAGEWTGRSFASLAAEAAWEQWNTRRSAARPPGGESMAELQDRVVAHIDGLHASGLDSVIIVTHAEPIRAALLHYRDMPLDRFGEIEIAPASVSILRMHAGNVDAHDANLAVLP